MGLVARTYRYQEHLELAGIDAMIRLAGPLAERRVLDAGTGTGLVPRRIEALGARPTSVIGVDARADMLAQARRHVPVRTEFMQHDLASLPFDDGAFDVVFASFVLHVVAPDALAAVLAELRRVTADGGCIVTQTPSTPAGPLGGAWRATARLAASTPAWRLGGLRPLNPEHALVDAGFQPRSGVTILRGYPAICIRADAVAAARPVQRSNHIHDLIVIGGGSAGLVAAQVARTVGASVVLIEREPVPGGDCLWTGCVPSKALIAAASRAHAARTSGDHGIDVTGVNVDFSRVMQSVREAQSSIEPHDSFERLDRLGVVAIRGTAKLIGDGRVAVVGNDGEPSELRGRHVLLATGSRPVMPPIPGIDDAPVMTTDDVWKLEELPERLLVVGGGAIGCELAQAFARLGSDVELVEMADRLLAIEEPFASEAVAASLNDSGVTVHLGASVASFDGASATLADGRTISFDRALVSVGRTPDVGEVCGSVPISLGARGEILVDEHQRTSVDGVWAAGDITSQLPFTHAAGAQGANVALNALLAMRRSFDADVTPWVTYTDPEVGRVGATQEQAREQWGEHVRYVDLPLEDVDRAVTDGATAGRVRLVMVHGRIVGATAVGRRAGELMSPIAAQVGTRGGINKLAFATHPYPTFGEATSKSALAVRRSIEPSTLVRAAMRTAVAAGSRIS